MRAGFLDPHGRKMWRLVPYVLPLLVLLFAIFGPIHGLPATMTGLSAWGVLNVLGLVDFRQRKIRMAELECGPGYIDIRKAGTRNQRIYAKEIVGGTTARTANGLLVTLQHRGREEPITLEVANDAEAEKVRHALGIGHGGFGMIAWRTRSDSTRRAAFVGHILVAFTTFITVAMTLAVSHDAGLAAGVFLGMFGFIGAILAIVGWLSRAPEPSIVMTATGLDLKTPRGWFRLPYDALQDIETQRAGFFFRVPEPYNSVFVERARPLMGGPSDGAQHVILSQLRAAAQRARGMGPQKNDVSGRVDVLRRNGESPRDWLVRLDMAGQMLVSGSGYRGNTLDSEDLWAVLEDPEAETELRAAAARVLRHSRSPSTRMRIASALAAVRDDSTNRRLRIAVRDDLDAASQELAFIDAEEQQTSRLAIDAFGRTIHGR
jgi:uncharacterized protein with PIN domain